MSNASETNNAKLKNKNTFFKNLHLYAIEFIELCQATHDNLTQDKHAALSCLAKYNSIVITQWMLNSLLKRSREI